MVQDFIRGISQWPANDRREIALALIKRLSATDLSEVLVAATDRLQAEAAKRRKKSHGRKG
jgi:hypothetical protein